ncbi:hypothetical protein [Methylocystis iwaonis]|uniref:hypothetical protein n=1 Tax=Methylocystis iwaonis TaxID=2885079 RepID=UPI002E7AEC73|nr:hypothetical protein [Methylocystis iwaonis]
MNRRNFVKLLPLSIGAASAPSWAADGLPIFHVERFSDRLFVAADRVSDKSLSRATLQEAIHLASRRGLALEFGEGVFRTRGFVIDAPLSVRGTPGRTIIKPMGQESFTIDVRPQAGRERLSGVSLSGLTFSGGSLPHAMGVNPLERPIDTLPYAPERFNGLLTAWRVDGFSVSDCVFEGAPQAAVALWECQGARISNNRISLSRVAMFSHAGRDNVFFGNDCAESIEFGVYLAHFA